jgi:hypothetical protein
MSSLLIAFYMADPEWFGSVYLLPLEPVFFGFIRISDGRIASARSVETGAASFPPITNSKIGRGAAR